MVKIKVENENEDYVDKVKHGMLKKYLGHIHVYLEKKI